MKVNEYIKGSIVDALFIMFIVFAIIVISILGITTLNSMISNESTSKYTTQETINMNKIIVSSIDTLVSVVILGVIFLSISLVLYLRVPFGFVGLVIFILPFMLFFSNYISGFLKNLITYYNLTETLSLTYTIVSNFPVLILIFLFVLIILQYSPLSGVFSTNE